MDSAPTKLDLSARLADLEEIQPDSDLDAVEAQAVAIADTVSGETTVTGDTSVTGDTAVRLRARLLQAELWRRRGRLAAAARVMWEVNRWAAEHRSTYLWWWRSHLLLARVYDYLGDHAGHLDHTVSCVELLDDEIPARSHVTSMIQLADALARVGSYEDARQRYAQAEKLAAATGDVLRLTIALNNLAYTECEAGQLDAAWAAVTRLRAAVAANGWPIEAQSLDTMARIEIALGRYDDAVHTMYRCIDVFQADRAEETNELAEYLLSLAVAQRHRGALDAAQEALHRSRALCDERELGDTRVRVRQEQAAVYAAQGDFRRAYDEYIAFHTEHELLRAQQREAQARNRQAMFETAEARRDAERFREQAYRDPLTGLANRRHVDEEFPDLLRELDRTGQPLSLALVDLDHFKRINDTCSHEVGDQVLVGTAGLLTRHAAAIGGGAFAARLGGEEFLIVMPHTPAAVAVHHLEDLLGQFRGHHWRPMTGDLPVTASIGVVTAEPGHPHSRSALLSAADRNLYLAKGGGRDRLVAEPPAREGRRRYRDADRPAG